MSIVGFRKQKEANSGKYLQRWGEEEVKVTLGQRDGKWVETESLSKNSPAPTMFNISLVLWK